MEEYLDETFYCSFLSTHYIICECGEVFASEDLLKVHLERELHTKKKEIKEYQCNLCTKVFTNARACSSHFQRIHLSNGQTGKTHSIVCEICGKKYASNAALRYHQRIHTGERPYKCHICDKTFTMPLFLQVHVRTHTGERPYQCNSCPKAFSNKAALLRHDRVHTGVKPYTCPVCGKTFTQSNSMKLHVNTVHLKQPAPYKSKARLEKIRQNAANKSTVDPKTNAIIKINDRKPRKKVVKTVLDANNKIYYKIQNNATGKVTDIKKDVRTFVANSSDGKVFYKLTPTNVKLENLTVDETESESQIVYQIADEEIEMAAPNVEVKHEGTSENQLEIFEDNDIYEEVTYEDDVQNVKLEVFDVTVHEYDIAYGEEIEIEPDLSVE